MPSLVCTPAMPARSYARFAGHKLFLFYLFFPEAQP